MKWAQAISMAVEHGGEGLAVGADAIGEVKEILSDGKIEPGEILDAAEEIGHKHFERTGSGGDVLVEVPVAAADAIARVDKALAAVREDALKVIADRKVTKREAHDLAIFSGRQILAAIPGQDAQGA